MSRNITKDFNFMETLNTQGKPNRYEPSLEDTDRMPFGKYKDELMQDVPASYLDWLYNTADTPLKSISIKEFILLSMN